MDSLPSGEIRNPPSFNLWGEIAYNGCQSSISQLPGYLIPNIAEMKRVITLLNQKIWLMGILLGIIAWIFDGLIDFLFFNQELPQKVLVEILFFPEPIEIWMRSFNFFILAAFGWFAHIVSNRQKRIQEQLKLSQDQGKRLLRQYRAILDGTGQYTGENFFSSMVNQLADTLNVRYAFIGTLVDEGSDMQSLSYFADGKFLENMTYKLKGTPCENVLNAMECMYPKNVQAAFPQDHYLKENNIESYLGHPLMDMEGSPIGIMSVLDTEPFDEEETHNIQSILKSFATRVEAEMRRIQIEKKLEHYASKLEQSNQDLLEFAYIASHDLKEPLRKITVFGQMLAEKMAPLDPEPKDLLMRMTNGADRMNELIDDLLRLSRIQTQSSGRVKSDLNKIVKAILEELEIETQASIKLAELPTLNVDQAHIRQLFQNLIGNSIKYKKSDQPLEITIHSRKTQQKLWEISVTDNGIGFEEKYAKRIFKPFERLHGKGVFSGTGMGLTICEKIVTRHGGSITAKGSPGKGATFTFTLPEE